MCGSKKGLGVEEKLEFLNFALYRNITKSYSSEPSPLFSPPLEKFLDLHMEFERKLDNN